MIINIARETGKAQRQATAKLTDILPDRLHIKNITTKTIIIRVAGLLAFVHKITSLLHILRLNVIFVKICIFLFVYLYCSIK